MSGSLVPSVSVDAVLDGQSINTALKTVRQAEINAFEFWCWWEKNLDDLEQARDAFQLQIAGCCTRFISLVDPAHRTGYLKGLQDSIEIANRLKCKMLISQVGDERPGVARAEQHQSLVDGLKEAVPMLAPAGITLVIEPLNVLVDHAGYYLLRSDEAFDIVDEVGSPNVKVVFDIYHQQISEGHLINNITQNIGKIGHFHAAGNPGRHELSLGEINYPEIFAAIQDAGYEGYVGLEYWPKQDPLRGLKETAAWLA